MARRKNDNRGGPRVVKNPAPVSGAGKDSKRTDGEFIKNPSNATQAARPIPAAYHGQRQELMNQQQSAPMAAAPQLPPGVSPAPSGGGNGGISLPFDPWTNNDSGGSDSTSTMSEEDIILDDTDMYLSQLLALVPGNPDLMRLLTSRRMRGGF